MNTGELLGGVALRHVIEDALALLRGDELDKRRRAVVVSEVTDILQEGSRGSRLAEGGLFVAPSDKPALEVFSFLNRHFEPAGGANWRGNLDLALSVIQSVHAGDDVSDRDKQVTVEFLESLLASLQRVYPSGMRREPQEIEFKL